MTNVRFIDLTFPGSKEVVSVNSGVNVQGQWAVCCLQIQAYRCYEGWLAANHVVASVLQSSWLPILHSMCMHVSTLMGNFDFRLVVDFG